MNLKLCCFVIINMFSVFLFGIASVQKKLLTQLLNHSISESISLDPTHIESSLAEATKSRETVDEEQYLLVYFLLNHAQKQSISLTDGIGTAVINGALSVPKEIITLLLNHAKNNSITLSASDIEFALQQAAKDWEQLSEDQLSVVYFLLEHARTQGITLDESGLGLALKEAAITLQVEVTRLILQHAEQQVSLMLPGAEKLSAKSLQAAMLELVKDRNISEMKQNEILFLILNYAKKNDVTFTTSETPPDISFVDVLKEVVKGFVTPEPEFP